MTTRDESSLSAKVLAEFDVPNDMASHFLVANQILHLPFMDFERDPHILHLCHQRVPPQSIAILTVDLDRFLDRLWNSDAVLVSPLPVLRPDFGDDPVLLLDGVRHPPSERWFLLNPILYRKLSKFNRI